LISSQYLRYHFVTDSVDVYIPTGATPSQVNLSYNRPIENLSTLVNHPVRLSTAVYEPGVNVLLDIHYDQLPYTETIAPLTPEEKKKLTGDFKLILIAVLSISLTIFVLINALTGFETDVLYMTLLVPGIPMVLICLPVYVYQQYRRKTDINKIMVRTVIAEVMTIRVKIGKSMYNRLYYRLGDGSLVHLGGDPLKPGNTMEGDFLQGRNGRRSHVIEKRRV